MLGKRVVTKFIIKKTKFIIKSMYVHAYAPCTNVIAFSTLECQHFPHMRMHGISWFLAQGGFNMQISGDQDPFCLVLYKLNRFPTATIFCKVTRFTSSCVWGPNSIANIRHVDGFYLQVTATVWTCDTCKSRSGNQFILIGWQCHNYTPICKCIGCKLYVFVYIHM